MGSATLDLHQCVRGRRILVSNMDDKGLKPEPICPSCGKPMRFVRAVPRIGELPALLTYECRGCGVALTEAEKPARPVVIRARSVIPVS